MYGGIESAVAFINGREIGCQQRVVKYAVELASQHNGFLAKVRCYFSASRFWHFVVRIVRR